MHFFFDQNQAPWTTTVAYLPLEAQYAALDSFPSRFDESWNPNSLWMPFGTQVIYSRWWQLKYVWNFHSEPWGNDSQFDSYFSIGLVQPPPSNGSSVFRYLEIWRNQHTANSLSFVRVFFSEKCHSAVTNSWWDLGYLRF